MEKKEKFIDVLSKTHTKELKELELMIKHELNSRINMKVKQWRVKKWK